MLRKRKRADITIHADADPSESDWRKVVAAERERMAAIEALRGQLAYLEETIAKLHTLTLTAPQDEAWNELRDMINGLDSIADVMRQALNSAGLRQEWEKRNNVRRCEAPGREK